MLISTCIKISKHFSDFLILAHVRLAIKKYSTGLTYVWIPPVLLQCSFYLETIWLHLLHSERGKTVSRAFSWVMEIYRWLSQDLCVEGLSAQPRKLGFQWSLPEETVQSRVLREAQEFFRCDRKRKTVLSSSNSMIKHMKTWKSV